MAHSELKTHSKRAVMITTPVLGVAGTLKRGQHQRKIEVLKYCFKEWKRTSLNASPSKQIKLKDLPLFEFQVLATSTDNFSFGNKLGQGGFGPVYKVKALNKSLYI